jgi:hypoxanthine phosphoribosyltransferase
VTALGSAANDRETPSFAHASEAEMARILDFYDVRWEYEPTTFPVLWNLEGEVVESFSPDFYLPELDMFLEMTTLKQRLVRKKNRKLRRLRELYPDIRIKLFYARDFAAMMLKYGRFALVESLSGTIGQMGPDRSGVAAPMLALAPAASAAEPLLQATRRDAPLPDAPVTVPPLDAPVAVPPAGASVSSVSAEGSPTRRSRTAARRLRRRQLRATASGAGAGAATTVAGAATPSDAGQRASEATSG